MKTGLCSVSFRGLGLQDIVELAKKANLDAIEWGGDVHAPAGDISRAEEARRLTEAYGMEVASYGSYWKVVDEKGNPVPFEPVLESALALGTDTIRIWAGHRASDDHCEAERAKIITHLRKALDLSQERGVRLGLEFHANTLSDSNGATKELLKEVDHLNLYTYWQPIYWLTDEEYRLRGLQELSDRVLNFHVFHWKFRPGLGSWGESTDRRPLEEGTEEWKRYFEVALAEEIDRYALMEFVRNDNEEQFLADAGALKKWVRFSGSSMVL